MKVDKRKAEIAKLHAEQVLGISGRLLGVEIVEREENYSLLAKFEKGTVRSDKLHNPYNISGVTGWWEEV